MKTGKSLRAIATLRSESEILDSYSGVKTGKSLRAIATVDWLYQLFLGLSLCENR